MAVTDLFDRLTSTSWGVGLFTGSIFGTYSGILMGLDTHVLPAGVLGGLISGFLLGATMGAVAHHQRAALRQLSTGDRVLVLRSVKRGEDVGEPRLAPAVIAYAEQLRRPARRGRTPSPAGERATAVDAKPVGLIRFSAPWVAGIG